MGLDSVELVMAWERTFGLVFSNADARRLSTVGDVVDLVVERLLREGRPRSRAEVFELVCAITRYECGVSRSVVLTDATRFIEDLGID